MITGDQPEAPAYFTYDAVLNAKERPTLSDSLERELTPLSLEDVLEREDVGRRDSRHPAVRTVRGGASRPAASTSGSTAATRPGSGR